MPPWTAELQAEVAATVTEEQEKRFSLCVCATKLKTGEDCPEYSADWLQAEWLDIWMGWSRLAYFKQEWEEIRDVFEAILEDEMADFDPEDFKRLEKEDRQHFGR